MAHENTVVDHQVTEKTPIEARQGVISGRVIMVLITSVTLAVAALVVSFLVA